MILLSISFRPFDFPGQNFDSVGRSILVKRVQHVLNEGRSPSNTLVL